MRELGVEGPQAEPVAGRTCSGGSFVVYGIPETSALPFLFQRV
jgi:hypothetical protein